MTHLKLHSWKWGCLGLSPSVLVAAVLPGGCSPVWWLPSWLVAAVLSGGCHPVWRLPSCLVAAILHPSLKQQPQFLGRELMDSAGPRGPHVLLAQPVCPCGYEPSHYLLMSTPCSFGDQML